MGKVPDVPEYAGRCACGECPSKPDEMKSVYCARGASRDTVARRGCLCEECPVQVDYDLDGYVLLHRGRAGIAEPHGWWGLSGRRRASAAAQTLVWRPPRSTIGRCFGYDDGRQVFDAKTGAKESAVHGAVPSD